MPAPRGLTRYQKERKRQEKAAAKRQERTDRRRRAAEGGQAGAGPPVDYEARTPDDFGPLPPDAPQTEDEEPA